MAEDAGLHDRDWLQAEVNKHGSRERAAKANGIGKNRFSEACLLLGVSKAEPVAADTLTLEAAPGDVDALLRDRGLDPADWIIRSATVNEWGTEDTKQRQLKVQLRKRVGLELVSPAADVRPIAAPRKPDRSKPRLVVFLGDEQEPHGDPEVKELVYRWLAENRPHEGVHLGDLMDLGPLSRHRRNPVWDQPVQAGVNAGYQHLRAIREASPDTAWVMLPCNHGERIRDYTLANAAELYGIRPADIEGAEHPSALSFRSLLHLDALGIRYLGGDGDYEHVEHELSPDLVTRHGWITGANTAEKSVRRLGRSVVVGHTHDQKVTYVPQQRGRDRVLLQAVEAGCLCKVEGGLGYVVNPEWVNGFATAVIHPDGSFVVELATFSDGVLRWRDQRYSARKRAA